MTGDSYRVGMLLEQRGVRGDEALERLRAALGDADISAPDDAGVFDVTLAGESFDAVLGRVWNALAAAGADDEIVFVEHPDLPDHWRHRARARP